MRAIGHGGAAPGMNGSLQHFLGSGITVVVLANRDYPAAEGIAQFIEFGQKAGTENATFFDLHGRLIDDGGLDLSGEGGEIVEAGEKLGREGLRHLLTAGSHHSLFQSDLQRGDDLQRSGKSEEVTAIAAALTEAAAGAFQIADFLQQGADLAEQKRFCQECGDHFLALGELAQVAQGMQDPVAQFAPAHGSAGAVQGAEQSMLGATTSGDSLDDTWFFQYRYEQ